jgi:hypothetical protein
MTYCCVRLEKGAPLRTTIPLSHYPHHAFIASFLVLAVQLPFQDDRFVALVSPVVSTRPHRSAWGWSLVCRFLPNDARICKQCRKYQNVGIPPRWRGHRPNWDLPLPPVLLRTSISLTYLFAQLGMEHGGISAGTPQSRVEASQVVHFWIFASRGIPYRESSINQIN